MIKKLHFSLTWKDSKIKPGNYHENQNDSLKHLYNLEKTPFFCVSMPFMLTWWAHEEIRWWAIAKGPGTNMAASSPLSTLKSEARFWPFSTPSPLHIWSTLYADVFCAFSYSVNVKAFFTSSLLCHFASTQIKELSARNRNVLSFTFVPLIF